MPGRIVLVEDDTAYRRSLEQILPYAGYAVSGYEDYRGALAEIEGDGEIDLLLTDTFLPMGTPHGIALAHMARMRRPRLPVLFITAYPEHLIQIPDRLGEALLKPISHEDLLDAIARAMDAGQRWPPGRRIFSLRYGYITNMVYSWRTSTKPWPNRTAAASWRWWASASARRARSCRRWRSASPALPSI